MHYLCKLFFSIFFVFFEFFIIRKIIWFYFHWGMDMKRSNAELNSDEEEVFKYGRWTLPPIGLLPPIKEDVDKQNFSHRLLNRVYVGNVGVNVTKKDILELFKQFGPIVNVNFTMDHKTMKHKGFAFVEFDNPHSAQMVINFKGLYLDNKELKVGRPVNYPNTIPKELSKIDRSIIFISNINPKLNTDEIKKVFECFGDIKDININSENPENSKKDVGYGYIKFNANSSATAAVKGMKDFQFGGRKLRVGHTVTSVEKIKIMDKNQEIPSQIKEIAKRLNKKENQNNFILLKNLIEFDELDLDFIEEMHNEMSRFGEIDILKVVIFQKSSIHLPNVFISNKNISCKNSVFLFVKFKENKSIKIATDVLDRRFYGGKRILVETCDESTYKDYLSKE
ncbi:Poly U-binding-splicing factor half pint [Spraguea lophii 42_110]|uniref:Poly U-binding-splicing factor half pint n=1 Tax=Spraguea lophii (strain 42_110) TaxID=1358809 RepID=S7XKT4_SPRLO|nr:Poly U-binding-splicing factor half pint [Spraguea lophii 42_110]